MAEFANRAKNYLKLLYEKYHTDAAPLLASAIAFAALFSLIPLILLGVSLVGYLIASPERQLEIVEFATAALPGELGDVIGDNIGALVASRAFTSVLAILGLIFAGLAVFRSIEWAMNRIFMAADPRSPLKATMLHLGLASLLLGLFILSTGAAAVVPVLLSLGSTLGLEAETTTTALTLYTRGAATLVSFILFLVILRFVPPVNLSLKETWKPALGAAVSWELAKIFFAWFLENLARYNVVYGSMGAFIAIMSWIYLSALILIVTAEIIVINRKKA